jgi:hypothetical protein
MRGQEGLSQNIIDAGTLEAVVNTPISHFSDHLVEQHKLCLITFTVSINVNSKDKCWHMLFLQKKKMHLPHGQVYHRL